MKKRNEFNNAGADSTSNNEINTPTNTQTNTSTSSVAGSPTSSTKSGEMLDAENNSEGSEEYNKKFHSMMLDKTLIAGMILNALFWLIIVFTVLKILRPYYSQVPVAAFLNLIKKISNDSLWNPLLLGILSSGLAAIIVLYAQTIFYKIRNWFPIGSLFRGIAYVVDPCLIFTIRMKDANQSGKFITPIPNYTASSKIPDPNSFEDRQLTPWVTSTFDAQALALIFHVLGRIGRTNNIQLTFADKEYDRWDTSMFILGGSWTSTRALKTCNPYFKFHNDSFILLPNGQKYRPSQADDDMGLLQKMINPNNGKPIWIIMGYRGAGTTAAAYALDRWWKYLGIIYGRKPFGLLVAFNDKDGWQQSHIICLYPKPNILTILLHPYAWYTLKKRMQKYT